MVKGGNLLATDEQGNYVNPIHPSTNVTVVIAQSTAPSLLVEWTEEEKSEALERLRAVQPNIIL